MSLCCNDQAPVKGIYKPINVRLAEFGREVYKGADTNQRVIMWVFSFFDDTNDCPVCRDGFERMYAWFNKYGLTNDPVRGVRMVLENRPSENLIYRDLGLAKLPVHIFADSDGKIFDILYDFPDDEWLDEYITPIIKKDASVL